MSLIQSHEWIYQNYPEIKQIKDIENGVICYDASGNTVSIDLDTALAKSNEHIADIKLKHLRSVRNTKLADTDWTQMGDVSISSDVKTEWETYRQALRDITGTYTSLDDVVWPEKPE